jgi:hypothetical protein
MTSKPPLDKEHAREKDIAPESPGSGTSAASTMPRTGWRTIGMAVAFIAIAGVVAVSIFHTGGTGRNEKRSAPARGLACPHLLLASDAYKRGDSDVFSLQITQAAELAQDTLQTSGEVFGEPERIALELHLNPKETSVGIERMLRLAVQDCQDVGPP